MAKPTLKDRLLTKRTAFVATSPLTIVITGAAIAIGILIGLPLVAAILLGVAAYGVRVALGLPKPEDVDGVNPFELEDPWRTFVWQAKRSQRQFREAVEQAQDGPLQDRLRQIADRIDTGVEECWHVGQAGQKVSKARSRIDVSSLTMQLQQLPTGQPLQANPALAETARALQSQLDTAKRLDDIITNTRDRLRLLDARLGELVTTVIELSARPRGLDDLQAVGADVDSVVREMEALRHALDESEHASTGRYTVPVPGAAPADPAPPPPSP